MDLLLHCLHAVAETHLTLLTSPDVYKSVIAVGLAKYVGETEINVHSDIDE